MHVTLDRVASVALVEGTMLAHPLVRAAAILLLLFAIVLCLVQARNFRSVTSSMVGAAVVGFGWMLYLILGFLPDYLAPLVGWANLGVVVLAAVGTGMAYMGIKRYAKMKEFFHHGRWEGYLAGLAGLALIGLAGRLTYVHIQLTFSPPATTAGTPIDFGPEQFTFTPPDSRWEPRETTVEHAKLMLVRAEPAATLLVIAEPIHDQHIAEDMLDSRTASWLRAFDPTVEFRGGDARRIESLRGYQQVATGTKAERPVIYITWMGAGDAYLYLLVGIADREASASAEEEFKELFGKAFIHHPPMANMAEGGKLSETVAVKVAPPQTAEIRPPPPKPPVEPVPSTPDGALGYPSRTGPRDLYNTRHSLFPGPLLNVVMGGDRYLVCRFATFPQLAVFDVERLDWWTFPGNLADDFVIAANRDRIFVGQRGGNKLAAIPFANRQAVERHELPAALSVLGAAIGRNSSDTPLLLVLPAGMGFYDPTTLAPIAVRPELPLGAVSDQARVRASADGHTFVWWDPASLTPGASCLHLAADGATHRRRPDDLGYLAPGHDGERIYSGRAGILDAQLMPVHRDRRFGQVVPSMSPAWYLDVQYAADGGVSAGIRRASDDQLAISVGDLTEMRRRPTERYLHAAEPTADQRYLYFPAYGRLITLPWTNDRLILRDIKLPE